MSSSALPRRSYRLMLKEAERKIDHLMSANSIPSYWVFCHALFEARAGHEWLLTQYAADPDSNLLEDLESIQAELPKNNFTKEQVIPVMSGLLKLCELTRYPEQKAIYCFAIMRLIFGPARLLLKYSRFREQTKLKCRELVGDVQRCMKIPYHFVLEFTAVCEEVEYLLLNQDSYNIFHSF